MSRRHAALMATCAALFASWACASRPAPTAAPPPIAASCYTVAFDQWVGPVGLLDLSPAARVFRLTRAPAPPEPFGERATDRGSRALTSRRFLAELLDGPSFGDLVPAVTPVWWPIQSAASLVISIADSSRGLEIQLVPSDSGLAGIAVAGSAAMVRDSTGTYTRIAARSPARARPVPCP